MNGARVLAIVAALTFSPVALGQQPTESADQQLKAAMHRELVGGDLRASIKEYEAIVTRHRDNRAVVARALLQMAQCYDKLGQTDARRVYEQVVRDYADQTEPATQARARLVAMSPQSGAATATATGVARPLPESIGTVQTISPDGTMAAGVDYSKGMNLAVSTVAAPQVKLLTGFDWTTTVVVDAWSAWSRDGRRIAYTQIGAKRDGPPAELRTTTVTGEAQTVFRAEPGTLVLAGDWLPDGRSLLIQVGRTDRTSAIGFIPATGGAFTQLRTLQWTGGYPDRARISPDGRFVLFSDAAAGPRDIQVISVDGQVTHRITDHPAEDHNPVWSPDGRHVAFLSSRLGAEALWVVAVKDGQLAGEPVRIKEGMAGAALKDWTAKGLVYGQFSRTGDIYTVGVDPANRQIAGPAQQLPYGRTGRNAGPVWSPDGRNLAFVSGSPGEPNRRYVVVIPEKGGSHREFLMPTSSFAPAGGLDPFDLRWFGDGSGLGFSGTDDQGRRSIFRLTLASGAWTVLPSPSTRQILSEWDQTGRRVFYQDESSQIAERDLETNASRPVTRYPPVVSIARGLRISPDRRFLAFTLRPNPGLAETPRLMVTDLQTGDTRVVLDTKIPTTVDDFPILGTPAWAPDGRSIVLARTTNRNRWPVLLIVAVDGSETRTVTLDSIKRGAPIGSDLGPTITDIVWSPDGARLMFGLTESRNAMSIIESVLPTPAGSQSRRVAKGKQP